MNRNEQQMYKDISDLTKALTKLIKLIERIDDWNKIKYPNDKEIRIIFTTLKPEETVTTALKNKE